MGYNQHFQGSDYILSWFWTSSSVAAYYSRKPGNSPGINKITNLNILLYKHWITIRATSQTSSIPKKDRHEGVIETGNLLSCNPFRFLWTNSQTSKRQWLGCQRFRSSSCSLRINGCIYMLRTKGFHMGTGGISSKGAASASHTNRKSSVKAIPLFVRVSVTSSMVESQSFAAR